MSVRSWLLIGVVTVVSAAAGALVVVATDPDDDPPRAVAAPSTSSAEPAGEAPPASTATPTPPPDDPTPEVPVTRFPTIESRDLNGLTVTVPRDFPTPVTIAVIAFDQGDQRQVETWVPALREIEELAPAVRYVELPVVGEADDGAQAQLDFWMREGIPDDETRGRTITLYVDRADFREAVGIDAGQISVLLLDADDRIVWRHTGPYDPMAETALRSAVEGLV